MPPWPEFQREPDKIDHFFNTSVRMAAIAGFPAFVGCCRDRAVAVPLVFGPQWTSAVVAVPGPHDIGIAAYDRQLVRIRSLRFGQSSWS